ncbi:hypothetical protein BDV97DRAFT_373159 [Delphinella strobiligena]|nr:hypothetical protein BDV97DRAFT_373159 [Delphinella strobiligena]
MHSSLLLPAFIGLAYAAPRPQGIALDDIEDLLAPSFVTPAVAIASQTASVLPVVDQISAASSALSVSPPPPPSASSSTVSIEKRDGTCKPYTPGSGPAISPDTVEAFLCNKQLYEESATAPTPDGYQEAFTGLNGPLSALNYMGLYTLTSYDTLGCASKCDQASGCVAFNMYAERDPSLDANNANRPNPPSTVNYKCTLWGAPVCDEEATNHGQYRAQFQVVITASSAYNKVAPPAPIECFSGPTELGSAINAPTNTGSYMGYKYYPFSQDQGYTPQTCAAACQSTTQYNKEHLDSSGFYQSCIQFNSYILSKNGTPLGLYCSMYNETWGPSYANNYGQYRDPTRYSVSQSYSYTLDVAAYDLYNDSSLTLFDLVSCLETLAFSSFLS